MPAPKPREPNEYLKAVWAFILAHPSQLDMMAWMRDPKRPGCSVNQMSTLRRTAGKPNCGTIGCIAGWTNALFPKELTAIAKRLHQTKYHPHHLAGIAAELLGVPPTVLVPINWTYAERTPLYRSETDKVELVRGIVLKYANVQLA